MNIKFPETSEFIGGLYQPSRVEGSVLDLEVEGVIPDEICGTFYQVAPDHQYPPMFEDDTFFNGDGMVKAFKFEKGRVNFTSKYVKTDRLKAQRKAGRSLNGRYRNVYTNDPLAAKDNTTANTNVLSFNGLLLAMKEDALPYIMDLETLETKEGQYNFNGQIKSLTFTAHPKIDPESGNLLAFTYCAQGDGSKELAFFEITPKGELLHEIWIEGPYVGMIHDFAITDNYIVLPYMPMTCDMERVKAGGKYWEHQPTYDQLFAVFSRKGNGTDVRWFKGPKNNFPGHVLNSFEKDGLINVDITGTNGNVFYFFPEESGFVPDPKSLKSTMQRWSFNFTAEDDYLEPIDLNQYPCEFPKCDDRFVGKEYTHGWMLSLDPRLPYNQNLGPFPFQFMNQLTHLNVNSGVSDSWYAGDSQSFQEPIFVPKSPDAPEGEGYIIALMNNLDSKTTDVVILDSLSMSNGPLATIHLPFRLRMSLHGSWAPAS